MGQYKVINQTLVLCRYSRYSSGADLSPKSLWKRTPINYTGMMQNANMNTVCIFAVVWVQSLVLPKNWRGENCIKSTTASHLWGSFALPPTPLVVLSLKATAVHGEKWCAGDKSNLRRWNNYEPTVLKGKLEAGQRKDQSLFSPFGDFKVDFSLWQHLSQSKICICICILLVIHKMLP